MNKAEKAKAYREELKAEGYCPRCYKRKAVAGKLHCKECEKYYYAYYHAHKAQRLEYAKQRNETGLHDRFKRGFVNINDLIKLLDSLDMDLIIRDRRYNR